MNAGPSEPARRTALVIPIAVGAFFGAVSTRLGTGDSDVFWHLVAGNETLASGLPRVDTHSWTVAGHAISTDQWLGQVLWALAFDTAGWRGIVALRALAIALLVALVAYAALRERPGRPLVAVLAALPAILLSRFVWTERPELFGFVCFAALVPLLRAGRAGSARALVALPVLLALWANLHGSFALGAVLVVAMAIEGALTDGPHRRRYAAVAIASLAATLLTPSGIGGWTAPGYHLLRPPREIQEWSVPDVTTLPGIIFSVALFATIVTALFARTRALRDGALLLPVLFVSLTATRQLPLFPIAAAPYLASNGVDALRALADAVRVRLPRGSRKGAVPPRAADAVTLAFAALALAAGSLTADAAPSLGGFPVGALASLRAGPGLLNQYDWGGYLISAAPSTPVFVDGRLTPYLGDVLADYTTVIGVRPAWREVIERRRIRQILVRPTDPIAVRARDLGWPIRASSDTFVLIDVP